MKAMQRWIAGGLIVAAFWPAAPARAGCEGCDALCPLLDYYDQRKVGIELWTKWASTNPKKEAPPAGATEATSMENAFNAEFNKALADPNRELPCELTLGAKLKNALGIPNPSVPDLETSIGQSCEISWKGKPLYKGDTLDRYEDSLDCKPLTDTTIKHEEQHQRFCKDQWAKPGGNAATFLDTPENVAENERLAWTRHKEELEKKIRELTQQKGCGWDPTEPQKSADPLAIPTALQVKAMQERAWRTNKEMLEWDSLLQNTFRFR